MSTPLDAATVEACERAVIVAIQAERLEDPVKDSEGDVAYANALVDAERAVRVAFSGIRSLLTPALPSQPGPTSTTIRNPQTERWEVTGRPASQPGPTKE